MKRQRTTLDLTKENYEMLHDRVRWGARSHWINKLLDLARKVIYRRPDAVIKIDAGKARIELDNDTDET